MNLFRVLIKYVLDSFADYWEVYTGWNNQEGFWNKNVIKFFTEVLGFVQLNGNVSILIRNFRTSR